MYHKTFFFSILLCLPIFQIAAQDLYVSASTGNNCDVITRPPPPSKVETFWGDYTESICGWTGALICLLFFFVTLITAGKRPQKPVAIPTFIPPRNMSPASVLYVANRYRYIGLTPSLVEMAVKGTINIRCEKKKYSLLNKMNTEGLRPEEQQIHAALFPVQKTAEEHRLNILSPPERIPELFERLLPYAIALKVSNKWCKKFDNVLKQLNYQPQWYDSSETLSAAGFSTSLKSLGTSFSTSVAIAQRDPARSDNDSGSSDWSSGCSGGGYSGGGGGGGGGRGW